MTALQLIVSWSGELSLVKLHADRAPMIVPLADKNKVRGDHSQ